MNFCGTFFSDLLTMRILKFILLSVVFSSALSLTAQVEDIEVSTYATVITVSIDTADANDKSLLNMAFGAHGGYKVVAANQSQFHFQINQ